LAHIIEAVYIYNFLCNRLLVQASARES